MFYIRILFGRDLSTKVHLNCAMENIYVMYLKDKGYMIFGSMWYSYWIAWLIMLYIVYLFSLMAIFFLLSFACLLNTFLIVRSLYVYEMIRNWHQTIAILGWYVLCILRKSKSFDHYTCAVKNSDKWICFKRTFDK